MLAVYPVGQLAAVIFAGVVLLVSCWPLGIAVLIGAPLMLLLLDRAGGPLRRRGESEQGLAAASSGRAADLVTGYRVLRGLRAERVAAERYRQVSREALEGTLPQTVYNFHVEDLHTYHVQAGRLWVRVHNECVPKYVYRGGSATDDALTPKPKDVDGLSTFDTPLKATGGHAGKVQKIDTDKLNDLEAIPNGTGHVSLIPKNRGELADWMAARGTGTPHLTQEVQDAIVDTFKVTR